MRQTTTELLIEVEEIYLIHKGSKADVIRKVEADAGSEVIEICPNCHQAIFAGDLIEDESGTDMTMSPAKDNKKT